MSRWRAPGAESSAYITPAGYRALESELQALWQRRAGVTRAITAAAAEGDRSENAEYIYRKKELRGIDARIGYLQWRMPILKIVSHVSDTARIFFGAWVTVEDDCGTVQRYRIVGTDELDTGGQYISIDSPLARALLGKTRDAQISLNIGEKVQNYAVVAIEYHCSSAKPGT